MNWTMSNPFTLSGNFHDGAAVVRLLFIALKIYIFSKNIGKIHLNFCFFPLLVMDMMIFIAKQMLKKLDIRESIQKALMTNFLGIWPKLMQV